MFPHKEPLKIRHDPMERTTKRISPDVTFAEVITSHYYLAISVVVDYWIMSINVIYADK